MKYTASGYTYSISGSLTKESVALSVSISLKLNDAAVTGYAVFNA